MKKVLLALIVVAFALAGSVRAATQHSASAAQGPMLLTAADFSYLQPLPVTHGAGSSFGCPGDNTPLTLSWSDVPPHTKSLALTMVDYTVPFPPGFFVHWIVYDIPAHSTGIDPTSLASIPQGVNGAGLVGYFGPCPPPIPPQPHVYTLELFALNVVLPQQTTTFDTLQSEMNGHILAVAPFAGTFGNPPQNG
jgi:Raf kinase inhibitor-like YbhB/YbcL family protein